MTRTALTPNNVLKNNGLALTLTNADASNGMTYSNDGSTILIVQNTDSSTHTVTITSVADPATGRTGDLTKTVAITTGIVVINFLAPTLFNQGDGTVYVDFSSATGMKVAAVRLNQSQIS